MRGRDKIEYKTMKQIGYQREAALIVNQIHEAIYQAAKPGVTPAEIDQLSAEIIAVNGAKSNFKGYYGYPSTICISVNDTVVHGIPDNKPFQRGDLVSFDCGCFVERDGKQWHGDSAFSVIIGSQNERPVNLGQKKVPELTVWEGQTPIAAQPLATDGVKEQLVELTRLSMWAGVAALAKGKTVAAVGDAVEDMIEEKATDWGWSADVVEEFIGHGIGTAMHQPPDVLNYRAGGRQAKLRAGMVLCVEPILTEGSNQVKTLSDQWTVKTVDGKLACHWESQVAILPEGISVLNQPDFGKAALAPFGISPLSL